MQLGHLEVRPAPARRRQIVELDVHNLRGVELGELAEEAAADVPMEGVELDADAALGRRGGDQRAHALDRVHEGVLAHAAQPEGADRLERDGEAVALEDGHHAREPRRRPPKVLVEGQRRRRLAPREQVVREHRVPRLSEERRLDLEFVQRRVKRGVVGLVGQLDREARGAGLEPVLLQQRNDRLRPVLEEEIDVQVGGVEAVGGSEFASYLKGARVVADGARVVAVARPRAVGDVERLEEAIVRRAVRRAVRVHRSRRKSESDTRRRVKAAL